jgi:adenylylsulfate kinase
MKDPLTWKNFTTTRLEKNKSNRHKSIVIWFTGLSASGKSTMADAVEVKLHSLGVSTVVLDGDNMRHNLCKDLGFDREGRKENMRRIAEVSKIFVEAGIVTLAAFISPFKKDRDMVKSIISHHDFIEISMDCPIEICESRDPKGYYKDARLMKIDNFTGVGSSYEVPENPDLIIGFDKSINESVDLILDLLIERKIIESR